MDKNAKFSNEYANKFYQSLVSEDSADLNTLAGPPQLVPGRVNSLKNIGDLIKPNPRDISGDYLHPENISVSVLFFSILNSYKSLFFFFISLTIIPSAF